MILGQITRQTDSFHAPHVAIVQVTDRRQDVPDRSLPTITANSRAVVISGTSCTTTTEFASTDDHATVVTGDSNSAPSRPRQRPVRYMPAVLDAWKPFAGVAICDTVRGTASHRCIHQRLVKR
jgi:hypothetical protein